MDEFSIIKKYFSRDAIIGDDAAVVDIAPNEKLVISVDAMEQDVHFYMDDDAHAVGYKLLAVNLSDMAAMGARPRFITLSLGLPQIDENWLRAFSAGLYSLAAQYNVRLIGGDTCKSSVYHASLQIIGTTSHPAVLRSGAQTDDLIYVSGILGGAALAFGIKSGQIPWQGGYQCQKKLEYPMPPVNFALKIRHLANAMIDISDGLLSDLRHILKSSNKGAIVSILDVPFYQEPGWCDERLAYQNALTGGEDYELCFTIAATNEQELITIAKQESVKISKIGRITAGHKLELIDLPPGINIMNSGYNHFG